MFLPQVVLELLDFGLELSNLLVFIVDLVVGRIKLCSQLLDELILVIDPVLEGDDGLPQVVDLVGQLLVEVVDLSLELGQVSDLVQQGLDLRRFVSKLLLEGVDEMILLLLTEVEGLNQGFQLLDPR